MLNPYKKRRRIRLPKTLNKIYSRSYISEAQNPNRKFKKHSRSYSKKRQIGFKELCIGNAKFRENLHKIQKSINEKYAKVRSLRDKKKRLEDIKKGIEKPVTMKKNSKKFKQKKLNLIQENEFLRAKLFKLKQEKMKRKRYRLSSSNENIRYYEILKEKYGEIVRMALSNGWLVKGENVTEDKKLIRQILTEVGEKYNFRKKKILN